MRLALLGSSLALGALLAGCARGPVLSESVARLRSDARAVLHDGAERLSPPGTEPRLSEATTLPCPSGQARAVVDGRIPLQPGTDSKLVLDHAAQLALDLLRRRGYRLQRPPSGGRHRRGYTMARETPAVHLTVRLSARPSPALLLAGATPCLPR